MPRYELVDGSTQKFWEIERDGNTYTVRYGKIGTDGQKSAKAFESDAKTTKEYDKAIASKVKKGYKLVASVQRAPEPGSNPDLEAKIVADLDDKAAWLVYADWLEEQEDPRGELIDAYANGTDPAALHAAHVKEFMGRFAKDLEPYAEFTWHMGYWKSIKVFVDYDNEEMPESASTTAAVLGIALRHPSSKFLQEIRIGAPEGIFDGEAEFQALINQVVKNGVRPTVRKLVVGDYDQDETEISWTDVGTHKGIWPVLPNLRDFHAKGGGIELGKINAPNLQTLTLHSGGLGTEPVSQIAKANLPELQRLEIWFGAEDYGAECSAQDAAKVIANDKGLPKVRWLGLMNSEFANDLPPLLAASKLLPQLEELDLSMGTMTDVGAQALIDNAPKFAHLKAISVDENFIGKDVAAQLVAALPQVTIGDQENAEDDYLYVSVGE